MWFWNWVTGRDLNNFEVLDIKSLACFQELMVEIWMLKEILVRTKKEENCKERF